MTASGSRIAEIAERHVELRWPNSRSTCHGCSQHWPCDASILAAMLTPERLAAALGPHPQDPELRLAKATAILAALEAQDAEVTR